MNSPKKEVILNFVLGFILVLTIFMSVLTVAHPTILVGSILFSLLLFWLGYSIYKLLKN